MATDGHGTTITFGTSAFTANLIDVSGPAIERAEIGATHMGSTDAMEFIPSALYDPGGVDVTFEHDPALTPPVQSQTATETITINWAGSASTYIFSGWMSNYTPTAVSGDRMTATATIRATGTIT